MILRISDPTIVKGFSLGITACRQQGVKGYLLSGPFANKQVTTIRSAPGGWTPTVMTQAARGSGGAITPGYLDDGSLANVAGAWRMQSPDGRYAELNFGTDLPIGVCAPLATTTSADGPVSAITWGVAGCASLGDQSCDGDLGLSSGTGCVAIDTSGSVLVATVQLGGCTPAAWPAVNFAAVTQTAKPTKAPTKAKKLPLCKKETRSTKKHPCRTR